MSVGEARPILCTVKSMRVLPMLLLLGILRVAVAQPKSTPDSRPSLFTTLVPDATITIKKHPMGADMVEITLTAKGYPANLIRSQIRNLGRYLGSEPRGVEVWDYILDPSNPAMHFTKATFAVDGVIDTVHGSMRLNPFAKAFAGAEKPWTIRSIDFLFQNEVPIHSMSGVWVGKGAVVERRFQDNRSPQLTGLEFRVQLLTQDPAKMDIPEPGDKAETAKHSSHSQGTDWTTIAVFLVAAGAVGALVYSLLLRGRPVARI